MNEVPDEESLRLIKAFYLISDQKVRSAIVRFAEAAARGTELPTQLIDERTDISQKY